MSDTQRTTCKNSSKHYNFLSAWNFKANLNIFLCFLSLIQAFGMNCFPSMLTSSLVQKPSAALSYGIKQLGACIQNWSVNIENIVLLSEVYVSKMTCMRGDNRSCWLHMHVQTRVRTCKRMHTCTHTSGWKICLGHGNADRQPCVKMLIHPSIHTSTHSIIHLFIRPSVCRFVYRPIDPPIHLSAHPSIKCGSADWLVGKACRWKTHCKALLLKYNLLHNKITAYWSLSW